MKYLVFEVSKEKFLIDISKIREIILNNKEITPMPRSKPTQVGIMALRDDIVNIFSVARIINKKRENEENILILENDIGLIVDKVYEVKDDANLNETEIEMNKGLKNSLIKKAFKDLEKGEIYLELNDEEILNE